MFEHKVRVQTFSSYLYILAAMTIEKNTISLTFLNKQQKLNNPLTC